VSEPKDPGRIIVPHDLSKFCVLDSQPECRFEVSRIERWRTLFTNGWELVQIANDHDLATWDSGRELYEVIEQTTVTEGHVGSVTFIITVGMISNQGTLVHEVQRRRLGERSKGESARRWRLVVGVRIGSLVLIDLAMDCRPGSADVTPQALRGLSGRSQQNNRKVNASRAMHKRWK
jgi:hypothetical protein